MLLNSETVGIARFSRHGVSEATWHPKRVTQGKSHVMYLNVWLTISHISDDAIEGNKGIKKEEKKRK